MSLKPRSVIILLVWSLFMGVTAISIGFGAVFPDMNRIAGPFVCGNGQMQVNSTTYNPSPGTTITTEDWMCIDNRTGKAQPVNEVSMFLIDGIFYGLILFAVIVIGQQVLARRRASRVTALTPESVADTFQPHHYSTHAATSFDVPEAEELRKLLKLRDDGLITEEDYEQKKAEILRRL